MARRTLKHIADNMVANMECLWKPAQSGKTRTIQQMIREDDGVRNHLNIVICSNNRLLVAQTRTRMHNDLFDADMDSDSLASGDSESSFDADDAIVGGVYSWMSGTKKTNISVRDLAWRVFRGEVSMIVCCPNKTRFRYLHDLLTELEAVSYAKPVNVWVDEADASVKTWSNPEFDFARRRCVRKVTLVSATFDEVFKFYRRIRVKAFPETHPECYRGLKDCNLIEESNHFEAAGFLSAMLDKHHATLVRPGSRIFAPGDISVESHEAVARVLAERGFAILMLNGQEKGFRLPDGRRVPITLSAANEEDPDEMCRVLAEHYRTLELHRYPFAVTGYLCLGRGITFQSRDFLFDAGVLPDIGNAAAAYQCVARVLGNIGEFSKKKCNVYLSAAMTASTKRQERIAVNLARLVHENEWADVGEKEVAEAAGEVFVPRAPPRIRRELHSVRAWKAFGSAEDARNYYVARFGSDVGFASKLHTDKETGKFKCSFANIASAVQDVDAVHANLASGNLWGQNYYSLFLETEPMPQIGTLKVGYRGDAATFFLCVAKAGEEEFTL